MTTDVDQRDYTAPGAIVVWGCQARATLRPDSAHGFARPMMRSVALAPRGSSPFIGLRVRLMNITGGTIGSTATVAVVISADPGLHIVRQRATDPRLVALRLKVAVTAASRLREAGRQLHVAGHIFGDGRVSGSSPRGNGNDAQVAVGVLAQIGADLLDASASLLSGTNHYAGAALLRQVVEVEYLSWAFANEKREASEWLNSTHQERLDFFTPHRLRDLSDGRFSAADYQRHCEQGGHPVPMAIPLLGNPDTAVAELLLIDLLLHSRRTTDNLIGWHARFPAHDAVADTLRAAQSAFDGWQCDDPLSNWVLSVPPATLP